MRATAGKVTVAFVTLGFTAFGLAACGTSAPPPAAGGPPLPAANASASAMVAAVCHGGCPSSLPTVAAGYEPLAAFGLNSRSGDVDFAGRPLEVCFSVGSLTVGTLSYKIGSPIGGGTTLFDDVDADATAMQGCVADPGNDSGSNPVSITAGGPGTWVVRIDQQD